MHGVDKNGILPNSTYHHEQHTEPLVRNVQDGVNATSVASSSSLGATAVSQDYIDYTPYSNSSDPYSYGNTGYPGYYSSYQQQPNHSYSRLVGAYQNTGAPYHPISLFPNSASYPGPASYSGTYYHLGDYQKAGSYPEAIGTYNSGTTATPSLQYPQEYKQWTNFEREFVPILSEAIVRV